MIALEPIVGDRDAEREGSVGREVLAGTAATGEAGRGHRLRWPAGRDVACRSTVGRPLPIGGTIVIVDGLEVRLRAVGLASLVAELRLHRLAARGTLGCAPRAACKA